MCVASVAGGMAHGTVRRSQPTLMLLSVLVIPAGLFPHPWWLLALALVPTNLRCAPTLSRTTEQVTELALPGVRGQAMGLLDSATRLGVALGSPAVGFTIDQSAPMFGFAAAGLGGVLIAFTGLAVRQLAPAWPRQEAAEYESAR